MKLEWFDDQLIHNIAIVSDGATKKAAEDVAKDAIRRVSGYSKELSQQIKVYKNTYKDKTKKGYRVQAQAPGDYNKYFAIFVELGNYSSVYGKYKRPPGGSLKGISPIHIEKHPYLRPAIKIEKRKLAKRFQGTIDRFGGGLQSMGIKENW